MIRWLDATLVMLMVASASITFWIKYDSRRIGEEVRLLERREAAELSAIELHRADWSLLSQPVRVQALVETHSEALGLRVTEGDQFVEAAALAATLDELAPESIEDAIAGAIVDADLLTGSVQ